MENFRENFKVTLDRIEEGQEMCRKQRMLRKEYQVCLKSLRIRIKELNKTVY